MTNLEKYKEELEIYVYGQVDWTMSKGKIVGCLSISCKDCAFYNKGDCDGNKLAWLKEEYKEPEIDWSKVAVDTPILVSNDGVSWNKRHFAKYEDGKVYAWDNGFTSWSLKFSVSTSWKYAKLADVESK